MNSHTQQVTLGSGPCKRLLSTSLVELVDGKPIEVEFGNDRQTQTFRLVIESMGIEDGSRESWNLKGKVVAIDQTRLKHGVKADLYFNTKRRFGRMTLMH